MLQNFLDDSLITLTEDAQFTKLAKAAGELAKKLNKDKSSIVRYTLAAIDPEVSPDNPEIRDAKEIIAKGWNTFSSVSKDTPVTYLRAIILEAIKSACNDIQIAALVSLAAGNIFHHLKLSSIEQKLIGDFLQKLSNRVSTEANNRFATRYGRTSGVGVALPDDTGSGEKSTRAELETAQMKTELLWWKFARYSTSFDASYKRTPEIVSSLAMAIDYSALLPGIYPKSANYFLKETYSDTFDSDKITLAKFVAEVEKEKRQLRSFIQQKSLIEGRLTFYAFINALIWDQLTTEDFYERVGVASETEVSKDLLNLWLFQDVHTYKIV